MPRRTPPLRLAALALTLACGPTPPSPVPQDRPLEAAAEPAQIARGQALLTELQCARCHDGDALTPPPRERHCVHCHQSILAGDFPAPPADLARWQHAITHLRELPELRAMHRLRRGFVAAFVQAPHDLRPQLATSMPRLHLSPADAEAIAAALVPTAEPAPVEPAGDPTRGRALLADAGCTTCHSFTGVPPITARPLTPALDPAVMLRAREQAPDLRFTRDRLRPAALHTWLADPAASKPGTLMPDPGLRPDQIRDLATYLLTAPLDPTPPPVLPTMLPLLDREVRFAEVDAAIFHKTCWHCHSDPGYARGDGGLERLRVKWDGSVAIGTTVAGAKFHVQGAGFNGGNGYFVSTDSANSVAIKGANGAAIFDSAYVALMDGTRAVYLGLSGTAAGGDVGRFRIIGANGQENFSIGTTGNVALGPISAAAKLSIGLDGTGDPNNYGRAIQITRGPSGGQQIAFIRSGAQVVSLGYLPGSNAFGFGLGRTTDASFWPNYLAIGGDGNIGINTAAPNARLSFGTNIGLNGIYLYDDGNAGATGFGISPNTLNIFANALSTTSATIAFGKYDKTTFTEWARITDGKLAVGTTSQHFVVTAKSGNDAVGAFLAHGAADQFAVTVDTLEADDARGRRHFGGLEGSFCRPHQGAFGFKLVQDAAEFGQKRTLA